MMHFRLFRPSIHAFTILLLFLVIPGRPLSAQSFITSENITDEHVQKAIQAIIEELYERKHEEYFWEPGTWPSGTSKRQVGGYTALTALALIHAGESYQDPRLRGAIEYLEKFEMIGTYAITLRASLWARLPDKYLPNLEKDVLWLLEAFNADTGSWDYSIKFSKSYWDNSLRQFGALALWEAAKRGGRIPKSVWKRIEEKFIEVQHENGSWNYRPDTMYSGSMTAAGLATLFITQDYLHAEESLRVSERVTPNQKSIDLGMKWLDENFSSSTNPGKFAYFYYYMYGIERVGLASGIKYFGGHDWFREGSAEIINRLCKWDPKTRTMIAHKKVGGKAHAGSVRTDNLGFSLLFLSRGRVPVAINKLRLPEMAWNNRPRDVANLTDFISKNTEQPVNWQIVELADEPEQWLDAPILYVATHQEIAWLKTNERATRSYVREMRDYQHKRSSGELPPDAAPPVRSNQPNTDKIKRYLDQGGLLLAMNETNSKQFTRSIEQMGRMMYPRYEWRDLPHDHWAYTIHTPIRRQRPSLRGLSNGVRELIILSPKGDLPRTLQGRDMKKESHYQTLANLYFYASEMDRQRPRLARHTKHHSGETTTNAKATIVHAMHEDNWNAEPQALESLAFHLAEQRQLDITIVEHSLSKIDAITPRPNLVFVSGVDRHDFNPNEQNAIKRYVEHGGVILFETTGGMGEFTLSSETMATTLFGGAIQSTLRTSIVTGEDLEPAPVLTRIGYRPYSLLEAFGARETTPRLRCLLVEDQPRVLFSREDFSNALLNQPIWGVSGYTHRSACDLLGNIIQYALQLP
ncbi:MAG: DUF4159 domain-containing protein [Planctomycetota bacterium]|nr:DUF4159 domain-containing protein [Planctomycetota bacterium]